MSHLYKIGLENFRVFKDYTEIEFAPITILTGANNSGKSSVLKMLNLLKDNLLGKGPNDMPFLMKGKLNFLNEHHKLSQFELARNNKNKPVVITIPTFVNGIAEAFSLKLKFEHDDSNDLGNAKMIEFSLSDSPGNKQVFKYCVINYEAHFTVDYNYFLTKYLSQIPKESVPLKRNIQPTIKPHASNLTEEKDHSEDTQSQHNMLNYNSYPDYLNISGKNYESLSPLEDSKENEILSGFNFFFYLISKQIIDDHGLVLEIKKTDPIFNYLNEKLGIDESTFNTLVKEFNSFILNELSLKTAGIKFRKEDIEDIGSNIPELIKDFFSFELAESFEREVLYEESGYEELNKYEVKDQATENFGWSAIGIEDFYAARDKLLSFLKEFMAKNLSQIFENASFHLNKLHTLDVVRANTQRLYTYKSQGTDFNEDLHEFLDRNLNHSKIVMDFIQFWLNKFGCEGDLVFLPSKQGVGISITVANRPLADLGYGLTQLMPILIKIACIQEKAPETDPTMIQLFRRFGHYYDDNPSPGTTLIIEEPETNLHPKFQSLLADLFIDANKRFNIQFILETHSEYLIRKLQYLTGQGNLKPADTAIYYFYNPDEKPEGEKQIKKIEIGADGRLSDYFGQGFFDEADNLAMQLIVLNKNASN